MRINPCSLLWGLLLWASLSGVALAQKNKTHYMLDEDAPAACFRVELIEFEDDGEASTHRGTDKLAFIIEHQDWMDALALQLKDPEWGSIRDLPESIQHAIRCLRISLTDVAKDERDASEKDLLFNQIFERALFNEINNEDTNLIPKIRRISIYNNLLTQSMITRLLHELKRKGARIERIDSFPDFRKAIKLTPPKGHDCRNAQGNTDTNASKSAYAGPNTLTPQAQGCPFAANGNPKQEALSPDPDLLPRGIDPENRLDAVTKLKNLADFLNYGLKKSKVGATQAGSLKGKKAPLSNSGCPYIQKRNYSFQSASHALMSCQHSGWSQAPCIRHPEARSAAMKWAIRNCVARRIGPCLMKR